MLLVSQENFYILQEQACSRLKLLKVPSSGVPVMLKSLCQLYLVHVLAVRT